MVWIVYYYREYDYKAPVFFGAFYSEASAAACLGMLLLHPDANPNDYHIVSMPVRTLT